VEHVFTLLLEGVSLPSTQEFSVPELELTAKIEPGVQIRLTVSITDISEQQADQRADELAQELYFRFLLRFGSKITKSEPPRLSGKTVKTHHSVSATGVVATLPPLMVAATGTVTSPLSKPDPDELVADIQLRAIAPKVPTSAQLYAAIEMFAAAIEAQNAVVRFLILYSALTLAALFKWHKGGQQQVDRLLLQTNSAIPTSACPRKMHMQETLYTKLRNDLSTVEVGLFRPSSCLISRCSDELCLAENLADTFQ